jgi:putative oxidoreductase
LGFAGGGCGAGVAGAVLCAEGGVDEPEQPAITIEARRTGVSIFVNIWGDMTRYSEIDWGLLLLRLGFAALLIGLHGWTRLLRAFNFVVRGQVWTFVGVVQSLGFPYPSVFAVLSALSESVAVVFVALGVFTRPAAAVIAFNLSVAFYNEVVKHDSFELPALYLLLALVILVAGPGRAAIGGQRPSRSDRIRR